MLEYTDLAKYSSPDLVLRTELNYHVPFTQVYIPTLKETQG